MKKYIKLMWFLIRNYNKNVRIRWSCNIGIGSKFLGYNRIGDRTCFVGQLGRFSYIGRDCDINGCVGNFCSIADKVTTVITTHPVSAFVSTCPSFYSKSLLQNGASFVDINKYDDVLLYDKKNNFGVKIGCDVWIGYGATLVGGVVIGDGAVVLANAMVTKNVEPYAIVGGVPARTLGYRFDDEVIQKLLHIKWWDKSREWLQAHADDFACVDEFVMNNYRAELGGI